MQQITPLNKKSLPKMSSGILAMLGPAFIWASVAQGSGELIWWPYFGAKYGTNFVGLLLPACLIQFFVNAEISRYTALTGEGIWSGFRRVGEWFSIPLFLLAVVCFLWFGGYASAGGTALFDLTHFPPNVSSRTGSLFWGYLTMMFFIFGMFRSSLVYRFIEGFMKCIAAVTVVGLLISVLQPKVLSRAEEFFTSFFNPCRVKIPQNWDISDSSKLVTAIAFAGMGGFFSLFYSYWIREKGIGMAFYSGKVTGLIQKGTKERHMGQEGTFFDDTEENKRNWREWRKYLRWDNLLGVGINIVTVMFTTWLAVSLLNPEGTYPAGWKLAVAQADLFTNLFGCLGRVLFLIIAAAFLGDTWLGVADAVSRQFADFTLSHSRRARKRSFSYWYYFWLVFLIVVTSITMPLAQPDVLIEISGVISIFAFVIFIPALYYLNYIYIPKIFPKWVKPSYVRAVLLWVVWAIYVIIAVLYLIVCQEVLLYFGIMLLVFFSAGLFFYKSSKSLHNKAVKR